MSSQAWHSWDKYVLQTLATRQSVWVWVQLWEGMEELAMVMVV